MLVEIAFRVQGLDLVPDVGALMGILPEQLDVLGDEPLLRGATTVEQVIANDEAGPTEWAVEVSYEGACPLDEAILDDPASLDDALGPLGRAVASVLVRIGDLPFTFRPIDSPPA